MKNRDDSQEVNTEALSSLSQILLSAGTAFVFGGDPYVASSSAFVSIFSTIRSRLKLKRAESFIEALGKYMQSLDSNFDWKNADKEDFQDFFEEALRKVSVEGDEKKVDRIKKIVAAQIINPVEIDISYKFLEFGSKLNENHIIILRHYYKILPEYYRKKEINNSERKILADTYNANQDKVEYQGFENVNDYVDNIQTDNPNNGVKINLWLKTIETEITASIKGGLFDFWIQDLAMLGGLVIDTSKGNSSQLTTFQRYRLTALGSKFMKFMEEG